MATFSNLTIEKIKNIVLKFNEAKTKGETTLLLEGNILGAVEFWGEKTNNSFAFDIASKSYKYKAISEKQAYWVAKFFVENELYLTSNNFSILADDEFEDDEAAAEAAYAAECKAFKAAVKAANKNNWRKK